MLHYIYIIVFCVAIICGTKLSAQCTLVEDGAIRLMMDSRKELNFKKDRNVKAWSVQIHVTRDKYEIIQKKEEFSKNHEDLKIDWAYEQPNYKLNVGAFYTKLEATIAMQKFIDKYPDAYVFKNHQVKPSDF